MSLLGLFIEHEPQGLGTTHQEKLRSNPSVHVSEAKFHDAGIVLYMSLDGIQGIYGKETARTGQVSVCKGIIHFSHKGSHQTMWTEGVLSTLLYILSLELRPGLGNIWWRINADGHYRTSFKGLRSIFAAPLSQPVMWKLSFWDMNPYIAIPALTFLIHLLVPRKRPASVPL